MLYQLSYTHHVPSGRARREGTAATIPEPVRPPTRPVERAVHLAIEQGVLTPDLSQNGVTTQQATDAVLNALREER